MDKIQENPFVRLAQRLVIEGMYGTANGSLSDAFWLISDDARDYIEVADIERARILRFVAKVLIGEANLPRKW